MGLGYCLFSLVGLRRLLGFFIKCYLLLAYVSLGYILLVVFILGCSVLSPVYYLRLIKEMYVEL